MYEEFREPFEIVESSLNQSDRGRQQKLELIDRFFIFLLYVTSGGTLR
jgi:hypothetical protein